MMVITMIQTHVETTVRRPARPKRSIGFQIAQYLAVEMEALIQVQARIVTMGTWTMGMDVIRIVELKIGTTASIRMEG